MPSDFFLGVKKKLRYWWNSKNNRRFSKPSTGKPVVVYQQVQGLWSFHSKIKKKKNVSPFQQKNGWGEKKDKLQPCILGKGVQKHGYIAKKPS